jgi:hypothetical protein
MSEAAGAPIHSYAVFFPHYLRQHANPLCRALHYVGTGGALLCVIGLVMTGDWRFVMAGLVASYGFAWIGHFFVEHNRPATFSYPLWSLKADHHMTWLALRGQLQARLVAAGVGPIPQTPQTAPPPQ